MAVSRIILKSIRSPSGLVSQLPLKCAQKPLYPQSSGVTIAFFTLIFKCEILQNLKNPKISPVYKHFENMNGGWITCFLVKLRSANATHLPKSFVSWKLPYLKTHLFISKAVKVLNVP